MQSAWDARKFSILRIAWLSISVLTFGVSMWIMFSQQSLTRNSLAEGATLATASLVSFAGAAGLTTWIDRVNEKATQDIFLMRQQVYGKALTDAMSSFTGGSPHSVVDVRAPLVLWGSDEVVEKWGAWLAFIDSLKESQSSEPPYRYNIDDEDQERAKTVLAELVSAMRKDLGSRRNLGNNELVAALFNKS